MKAKNSDNWGVPISLQAYLKDHYKISRFDPAPYPRPKNFDGLTRDWSKYKGVILVNPPFKDIKSWVKKCNEEMKKGVYSILLMPNNRSHTEYWNRYVVGEARVQDIQGRLRYVDLDNSAEAKYDMSPWGSVLVHFDPMNEKIKK